MKIGCKKALLAEHIRLAQKMFRREGVTPVSF